jgi:hypothetical protein
MKDCGKFWCALVLFSIALSGLGTVAAQSMREDQGLFDKPDGTQSGAKLKSGTPVKPLKRQGFWVEVEVNGTRGWLKVSMVNFGGSANGPSAIDTGRLGGGNIVSTSAVRGLSAKDLIDGKPNFEELKRLEQLSSVNSEIIAFLSDGNITASESKISLTASKSIIGDSAPPVKVNSIPSGSANNPKKDDDW